MKTRTVYYSNGARAHYKNGRIVSYNGILPNRCEEPIVWPTFDFSTITESTNTEHFFAEHEMMRRMRLDWDRLGFGIPEELLEIVPKINDRLKMRVASNILLDDQNPAKKPK